MPRQLPANVRGFVNRSEDLRLLTLTSAEATDRVVVCVVVGTAGVGKTSLALRWAHQFAGDFSDGQLRALGVPGNLVPADLDARSALFRSLLAGRRFLILLDNAASPTRARPLLPGTAGCRVLVTSRDKLADASDEAAALFSTFEDPDALNR
ncbi:hypothetical protein [Saccharothrix sp. NRRL B-16314]|uniref:hypothetical protein n=1 Tax=Saccharothrix sp. NRRL B-16314 TaxID=1463825 RepID=UPI0005263474|nr:hypothetical protein [Saccharothrix sp. NRRL B-16314]